MIKQDVPLMTCPSCMHKQEAGRKECESCGIIFSKLMEFTPIKTQMNTVLSPKEIMDIRKTQDRIGGIKHDTSSKMELIVHCHKEKMLDMVAYHLKKDNDKSGLEVVKKLASTAYNEPMSTRLSKVSWFLSRPLVMIPAVLFILLCVITIILRS